MPARGWGPATRLPAIRTRIPAVPTEPTPKSAAASRYYAQVQQVLLRESMLRTDPGTDIPVSAEALTENFLRIALFHEFRRSNTGIVRGETETHSRAGRFRCASA